MINAVGVVCQYVGFILPYEFRCWMEIDKESFVTP